MDKQEIAQYLKESLKVLVEVKYSESHGDNQEIRVSICLDGQLISADTSTVYIPEIDNG